MSHRRSWTQPQILRCLHFCLSNNLECQSEPHFLISASCLSIIISWVPRCYTCSHLLLISKRLQTSRPLDVFRSSFCAYRKRNVTRRGPVQADFRPCSTELQFHHLVIKLPADPKALSIPMSIRSTIKEKDEYPSENNRAIISRNTCSGPCGSPFVWLTSSNREVPLAVPGAYDMLLWHGDGRQKRYRIGPRYGIGQNLCWSALCLCAECVCCISCTSSERETTPSCLCWPFPQPCFLELIAPEERDW